MSSIILRLAGLIGLIGLVVQPAHGQSTQTQRLEANILNNMREEIDLTHEIYLEIGLVPILVGAGEMAEWIKMIDTCHDPAAANSIIAKIHRVEFLQQDVPKQIGTLRNLNVREEQHFLNSRSYMSLQNKMRQLENMPRTTPANACRAKLPPPPPRRSYNPASRSGGCGITVRC
jgi:hypothetical protein